MKFRWTCLMLLAAGLLGCDGGGGEKGGKLKVVTTTTQVTDLVKVIAGDRVEVEALMGPQVDPHSFVPTLADSSRLEGADVVVYSGLGLEGRLEQTLEAMEKRGKTVWAVTAGLPEERLLAPQEGYEGAKDPHVWGDVALWREGVSGVVEVLAKADPEGAEEYRKRGEAYREELTKLDEWVKAKVAEIPAPRRALVTSHDAFFYLGRAYGLEVRGLQGVSTSAEAGLKDRENLVAFIRERGVKTLFGESSVNDKGLRAVAAEAGAKVSGEILYSDAMGKPGDLEEKGGESYDRGTYVGMVKHNVWTIVEGLK